MGNQTINCIIVEKKISCSIGANPIHIDVKQENENFSFKESSTPINCTVAEKTPINISLETGGLVSDIQQFLQTLSAWLIQEDLTLQVIEGATDFITINKFYSSSLKVFINGLKEKDITILTDNSFRVYPGLQDGDFLEVEFIRKIE